MMTLVMIWDWIQMMLEKVIYYFKTESPNLLPFYYSLFLYLIRFKFFCTKNLDLDLDDDYISDDAIGDEKPSKSKKKLRNTDDITSAFASAEEFALMLEKTGSSKFKHGTSNAMFNDDKSGWYLTLKRM